jgi:hypothetical protein
LWFLVSGLWFLYRYILFASSIDESYSELPTCKTSTLQTLRIHRLHRLRRLRRLHRSAVTRKLETTNQKPGTRRLETRYPRTRQFTVRLIAHPIQMRSTANKNRTSGNRHRSQRFPFQLILREHFEFLARRYYHRVTFFTQKVNATIGKNG